MWTYGLFVYRPAAAQLGGASRTPAALTLWGRVATLFAISALFLWASGAVLAPLWAAAWTLVSMLAHAALRPVSLKAGAAKMGSDMWSAMGGGGRPQRPDREESDEGRGGGMASSTWSGAQQREGTRSGGMAAASPQWGGDSEASFARGQGQPAVPHTYEGAAPNLRARTNIPSPAAPAPLPRPGAQQQRDAVPPPPQFFAQHRPVPPVAPAPQSSQHHQQPQQNCAPTFNALPRPGAEKRRD